MIKKVSIITPVYNGEKYIERFINSIEKQTYSNIELIIIDDGSIDLTKEKINKHINLKTQIEIKYIYQENAGQAAAIANGIKSVTGEYLVWADSDDYFEYDAINKMVNFLENNPDADLVRANAIERLEEDVTKISGYMKVPIEYQDSKDIFEDAIFIKGINCFCGVYMVRFDKYKKNNNNLYIYPGKEGQNWQLILPSVLNNKCYYLNEEVYNYVIRKNSHSHKGRSFIEQIVRYDGMKKILKETLNILSLEDEYKNNLYKRIDEEYDEKIYMLYCKMGEKNKIKEYYKKIQKKSLRHIVAYIVGMSKILRKIYQLIRGE